jgi:hypothetical protein
VAQLGSALRSGRRGRWFKSSRPDHSTPRSDPIRFPSCHASSHRRSSDSARFIPVVAWPQLASRSLLRSHTLFDLMHLRCGVGVKCRFTPMAPTRAVVRRGIRNPSKLSRNRLHPACIDMFRVTGNSLFGSANLLGKHPFREALCKSLEEPRSWTPNSMTQVGDNNRDQQYVDMASAECDDPIRNRRGTRAPNSRFAGHFVIVWQVK